MRSTPKFSGSSKPGAKRRAAALRTGKSRRGGLAPSDTAEFARLVRQWPPRAIRSEQELVDSVERVESLLGQVRPSAGHKLYVDTLLQLIEAYEREHVLMPVASGDHVLAELVLQHELSIKQLAEVLEVSPAIASRILKNERSLTVSQVKRLAEHFSVSSQVFLN